MAIYNVYISIVDNTMRALWLVNVLLEYKT